MTDAELEALYEREIGTLYRSDPRWLSKCLRFLRRCVEARTLEEAVEILRRDGWGDPLKCALKLRGAEKCPTCRGTGFVDGGTK